MGVYQTEWAPKFLRPQAIHLPANKVDDLDDRKHGEDSDPTPVFRSPLEICQDNYDLKGKDDQGTAPDGYFQGEIDSWEKFNLEGDNRVDKRKQARAARQKVMQVRMSHLTLTLRKLWC
jgi:hypothetical protein